LSNPGPLDRRVGLADIEAPNSASADTVYLWFSMTKLVTATAVLQLADRGQLDLDGPVATIVPEFPRRHGGSRVTIRHLLSHSAGLANPIPIGWVRSPDAPAEDLDAFTARLLTLPAAGRPRQARKLLESRLSRPWGSDPGSR
jgi:CubicO group peptidase (beta-lactamase class C family)